MQHTEMTKLLPTFKVGDKAVVVMTKYASCSPSPGKVVTISEVSKHPKTISELIKYIGDWKGPEGYLCTANLGPNNGPQFYHELELIKLCNQN